MAAPAREDWPLVQPSPDNPTLALIQSLGIATYRFVWGMAHLVKPKSPSDRDWTIQIPYAEMGIQRGWTDNVQMRGWWWWWWWVGVAPLRGFPVERRGIGHRVPILGGRRLAEVVPLVGGACPSGYCQVDMAVYLVGPVPLGDEQNMKHLLVCPILPQHCTHEDLEEFNPQLDHAPSIGRESCSDSKRRPNRHVE